MNITYNFNFKDYDVVTQCNECFKNFTDLIIDNKNINKYINNDIINNFSNLSNIYRINDDIILDNEIKIKIFS